MRQFIDFHAGQPLNASDFDVRLENIANKTLAVSGNFSVAGGFELGSDESLGSTPFVDFHYGSGTQRDFNMRLINDENGWLSVRGGSLRVDSVVKAKSVEITSDKNQKFLISNFSGEQVLPKLEQLAVYNWAFTNSPSSMHVGPTAQDFNGLFSPNANPTTINLTDAVGVTLGGLKALQSQTAQSNKAILTRIEALQAELASKETEWRKLISEMRVEIIDLRNKAAH